MSPESECELQLTSDPRGPPPCPPVRVSLSEERKSRPREDHTKVYILMDEGKSGGGGGGGDGSGGGGTVATTEAFDQMMADSRAEQFAMAKRAMLVQRLVRRAERLRDGGRMGDGERGKGGALSIAVNCSHRGVCLQSHSRASVSVCVCVCVCV